MPKKLGRPKVPKKEYKGEIFSVRLSRDEGRNVWKAIEASGKKKPVWLREILIKSARLGCM